MISIEHYREPMEGDHRRNTDMEERTQMSWPSSYDLDQLNKMANLLIRVCPEIWIISFLCWKNYENARKLKRTLDLAAIRKEAMHWTCIGCFLFVVHIIVGKRCSVEVRDGLKFDLMEIFCSNLTSPYEYGVYCRSLNIKG